MQVDPKKIPPLAYKQAMATLASCIKQALKDPKNYADYEKWRQEHEEVHMES